MPTEFEAVNRRFETINQRFQNIDQRLDCHDRRSDHLETRLDTVAEELGTRINGVNQGLERLFLTLGAGLGAMIATVFAEIPLR